MREFTNNPTQAGSGHKGSYDHTAIEPKTQKVEDKGKTHPVNDVGAPEVKNDSLKEAKKQGRVYTPSREEVAKHKGTHFEYTTKDGKITTRFVYAPDGGPKGNGGYYAVIRMNSQHPGQTVIIPRGEDNNCDDDCIDDSNKQDDSNCDDDCVDDDKDKKEEKKPEEKKPEKKKPVDKKPEDKKPPHKDDDHPPVVPTPKKRKLEIKWDVGDYSSGKIINKAEVSSFLDDLSKELIASGSSVTISGNVAANGDWDTNATDKGEIYDNTGIIAGIFNHPTIGDLADDRCNTVKQELIRRGVKANKIKTQRGVKTEKSVTFDIN